MWFLHICDGVLVPFQIMITEAWLIHFHHWGGRRKRMDGGRISSLLWRWFLQGGVGVGVGWGVGGGVQQFVVTPTDAGNSGCVCCFSAESLIRRIRVWRRPQHANLCLFTRQCALSVAPNSRCSRETEGTTAIHPCGPLPFLGFPSTPLAAVRGGSSPDTQEM